VDTLSLFRRWFPEAPGHSLEALSVWLGVSGGSFHRAEADSMAVVHIFNEGVKRFDGEWINANDYLKR